MKNISIIILNSALLASCEVNAHKISVSTSFETETLSSGQYFKPESYELIIEAGQRINREGVCFLQSALRTEPSAPKPDLEHKNKKHKTRHPEKLQFPPFPKVEPTEHDSDLSAADVSKRQHAIARFRLKDEFKEGHDDDLSFVV